MYYIPTAMRYLLQPPHETPRRCTFSSSAPDSIVEEAAIDSGRLFGAQGASTVDVFRRKALKPFDEMVLGAVLADAEQRSEAGQGPLYLCNLNTRDFEPTSGDGLVTEYGRFGLACLPTFDVP